MRKHAASYRAYEPAVGRWKADAAAELERRNALLEASVVTASENVARRRQELAILRQRLSDTQGAAGHADDGRPAGLDAALRERSARLAAAERARDAAAADAAALRASVSWQVTAPLRAFYDVWRAAVGSRKR